MPIHLRATEHPKRLQRVLAVILLLGAISASSRAVVSAAASPSDAGTPSVLISDDLSLFNGVDPTITVAMSTATINAGTPVAVEVTSIGTWIAASLSATVEASKGTVAIDDDELDLTASPTYPSDLTGAAVGFFGSASDVLTALEERLTWTGSAPTGTGSVTVTVAEHEDGLVFNPANGHFYLEVVSTSAITWEVASNSAVNLPSRFGMTPYLATITSEAENTFVASRTGAANVWIGATDDVAFVTAASTSASTNPGEGNWHWATGPEAGQQFWQGDELGTTVSGRFAGWASGEPNNAGSVEDCAVTNRDGVAGQWNDLECGFFLTRYLAEYGPPTGGSGAVSASATSTASIIGVAAPTLLAVTGSAGTVTMEFTPGADGGTPILGYDVSVDGGSTWRALSTGAVTSPLTVGGLAGGTVYPIQLRPRNAYGPGPMSNSLVATTSAPPPPPTTTVPPSTTTIPSSTTTEPPTTTVPTPVTVPGGATDNPLPELRAGESVVYRAGVAEVVTARVEDTTDLVVGNDDFELRLRGDCSTGCTIADDGTGRQVLELEESGGVTVAGDGFAAGTPVYVWIFSAPHYVGELEVAADGTFLGTLPLPEVAVGEHTLQVNGTSADGAERSANLGVVVRAAPDTPSSGGDAISLPATGTSGTGWWLWVALLAMVIGGVAVPRRRPMS